LDGKTAIVTGANTGIGKETAADFARRGARVIMACRNLDQAEAAMKEIVQKTGNKSVVVKHLDLASLKSVRAFAEDVKNNEARLDILINNAGVFNLPEFSKTEDSFETIMAVNHFGHFLLTNLLLDLLKQSAPSRVVVVSSVLHRGQPTGSAPELNFENMNSEISYNGFMAYAQSKLANILFTRELARRLEGTGVTVNSLHPGKISTDIRRHFSSWKKFTWNVLFRHFGKAVEEGAQTQIHLAVSEELEEVSSGLYFSDCKQEEPSKHAQDDVAAKKLWDVSAKLVGLEVTSRLNIQTTMKMAKENHVTPRIKSKPSCFNTGPDKFETFVRFGALRANACMRTIY
jgi:light-dependent protochlorophyllide reductase